MATRNWQLSLIPISVCLWERSHCRGSQSFPHSMLRPDCSIKISMTQMRLPPSTWRKVRWWGSGRLRPAKGLSGMAIDSEHRRIFAVCSHNAMLVVFDIDRHQVSASLPIGSGPDVVSFDPGLNRIYAASKGGKLTVVQQDTPDAYRKLEDISTHYGAHTLVVDPAIHRVFVGYASLFNHPRIAVFSPI